MRKYVCVFLLLFIVGCGANYTGHSNYSRHPNYSPYAGFSSHFKKTRGTSNLTYGYKDPPVLDANSPLAKFELENSVKDYLDGVVNDLKEVKDKADNATKKINAVVDAVNLGFEYFNVRHVGSVLSFRSESNFELFGYPEFPDFDYFPLPPRKPHKPLYLDDEFVVESYNASVRKYNREVADFAATVKDYIEDAEHYIKNCKNDYEEIRQKGLNLLSHIESLDINVEVALYEPRKTDEKIVSNKTSEKASEKKIDFVVGATKCSICGRDIGKDEMFCLYKLKRVCPSCFKAVTK